MIWADSTNACGAESAASGEKTRNVPWLEVDGKDVNGIFPYKNNGAADTLEVMICNELWA